jgi:hypothetical protein
MNALTYLGHFTGCKGYTIKTANVYSTFTLFKNFHYDTYTYVYYTMTKQLWGGIHTQITFIQRRYYKTIIHVTRLTFFLDVWLMSTVTIYSVKNSINDAVPVKYGIGFFSVRAFFFSMCATVAI